MVVMAQAGVYDGFGHAMSFGRKQCHIPGGREVIMLFGLKCWLICSLLALPLCAGSITLSSSKYPRLLYPMWYNDFLYCDDTIYILVSGSRPSQEPLQILEWKQDRVLSIFQSTPREDLYKTYSLAISGDCERIYMGAFFGGSTYSFDLSGKFELAGGDEALSEALFVYKGGLVRGAKDTKVPLKVLRGNTLPVLDPINKRLNEITPHPVEARFNFNRVVLAREGQLLAVGAGLQHQVFLFDLENGNLLEILNIRVPFRGYRAPPDTFSLKRGPDYHHRTVSWFISFHSLLSLRVYQGKVFGRFRMDDESHGVWVELGGSYRWDNDKQPTILMDITPGGCILGTTTGQDSDEVTWTLWRSKTLPQAP